MCLKTQQDLFCVKAQSKSMVLDIIIFFFMEACHIHCDIYLVLKLISFLSGVFFFLLEYETSFMLYGRGVWGGSPLAFAIK